MIITLNTTIKELLDYGIISVRSFNACKNNKLITLADIKKYAEAHNNCFMSIHHCGRKTSSELLSLIQESQQYVSIENIFDTVTEPLRQIFIDEYELFVNDPNCDEQLINLFKEAYPNPGDFFKACLHDTSNLLSEYTDNPRLQYFIHSRIVNILAEINDRIKASISSEDDYCKHIQKLAVQIKGIFEKNSLANFCRYELSEPRRQYLESSYSLLVSKSDRITKNLANAYFPSMYELIPLLELNSTDFIKRLGTKKTTASSFFSNVVTPFHKTFTGIVYNNIDDLTVIISSYFPFLSETAVAEVRNYVQAHSSYPMFKITCEFLLNSDSRDHQVFCYRYGLINPEHTYNLLEIAKIFGLTRERIRQILKAFHLSKEPLAMPSLWSSYFNNEIILVTEKSEFFSKICSEEAVVMSFIAFAKISAQLFKLSYCDEFECAFICSKKHLSTFHKVFTTLTTLKKEKYAEDTSMHISDIISPKVLAISGMYDVITTAIIPSLNLELSNDFILFKKNYVDVEKEAYHILYEKGEPMRIDDIIAIIKSNNPSFRLSPDFIKNKIRLSDKILPIGNTTMYKLNHWRTVFGGTIRDLIRQIMAENDTPVSLDELTSKITNVFEHTNRSSISSNLQSSSEFVSFGGRLYGLRSKTYSPEYAEVDPSRIRLSFEERFSQFKDFVNRYARLPYNSGADEENTLWRWYNNVFNQCIESTDEQRALLKEFIDSNRYLPQNGTELNFKKNCSDFIRFVESKYELPTRKTSEFLFNWFRKNLDKYLTYTDNRKLFFSNLLEELNSYGFVIQ